MRSVVVRRERPTAAAARKRHGRTRHGRTGYGRTGYGRTRHGRTRHGRTRSGRTWRARSNITVSSLVGYLLLAVWAMAVIAPLLWTMLASFKTNTEIFIGNPLSLPKTYSLDSYERAWETAHLGRYFLNSIIVVSASTAGTILLGSMAAYVLAQYTFIGNRVVYYLFVAGLAFPVFLALVPLFLIVRNFGMINTYHGLVLVYIAYSLPFTVFFLTAFFKTLPKSVAEAALIDGASQITLFFRIMLPMAKPGLISVIIFNVIGQWNQYLLPVALMQGEDDKKYVLTQGIARIQVASGYRADWPAMFAALTMSIVPMIVMYVAFRRQIQQGMTAGAVK